MKVTMQERYTPMVLGVNSTTVLSQGIQAIGGFLAVTAGTITVVNSRGVTVLNAFPVTAGSFVKLPIYLSDGQNGGTITLAGGAGGTLLL